MAEQYTGPVTRKINICGLGGERPIPRPCVLPGLRARQIGMLTSAGGVGKSFMALKACIEMAAGLPILGGIWGDSHEGGKPVVYASLEDDLEDLLIRVYDICENLGVRNLETLALLERNLVVCNARELATGIPPGIILPTNADGKPVNPKLIVIDTLSRFMAGKGDENATADMTGVFQGIEAHLEFMNAAALILHHVSKADMGAQQNDQETTTSSRGSSVITFNARAAWSLAKPSKKIAEKAGIPEDDRWQYAVLHHTKVNFGRPHDPQWFRKVGEGVPVPIDEPAGPPQSQERLNPRTSRQRTATTQAIPPDRGQVLPESF